nr:response regulator [uncultured Pseudomonas sp.]
MRSLKVLLLEPHAYRLMNLHQMLNGLSIYDVRVAETTLQAHGVLERRGPVDIVICDPLMPEHDGMGFIEHLALHGLASALIVLSGARRSVLQGVVELIELSGLRVLGSTPAPASPSQLHPLLLQHPEAGPVA